MQITIDKTACWFGYAPADEKIHCYLHDSALCDSHDGAQSLPVITEPIGPICRRCLVLLNTAIHSGSGARYGGHAS